MTELIIGGVGIVVINILVWVFLFGKRVGGTNTRLKVLEEKVNNPTILPDCNEIFIEIRERLSSIEGAEMGERLTRVEEKIDRVLFNIKVNQKNNEKRKTQGRGTRRQIGKEL